MIFRTPFFLPWLYPQLTWRIPVSDKILYLTFDDGPIPGPTEFVLDTLKEHAARATFFCIGDNVCRHPEVYQRMVAEGHRTGNHTFNHLKGWNTKTAHYLDNVRQCEEQLAKFSSADLPLINKKLFRPPYGRITRTQIAGLADKYSIIMWDVLTLDYDKHLSPERCLQGSVNAARPGSVIVFHDSLKAEKNMKYALPRFMDHFARQGYSFQSLPD